MRLCLPWIDVETSDITWHHSFWKKHINRMTQNCLDQFRWLPSWAQRGVHCSLSCSDKESADKMARGGVTGKQEIAGGPNSNDCYSNISINKTVSPTEWGFPEELGLVGDSTNIICRFSKSMIIFRVFYSIVII